MEKWSWAFPEHIQSEPCSNTSKVLLTCIDKLRLSEWKSFLNSFTLKIINPSFLKFSIKWKWRGRRQKEFRCNTGLQGKTHKGISSGSCTFNRHLPEVRGLPNGKLYEQSCKINKGLLSFYHPHPEVWWHVLKVQAAWEVKTGGSLVSRSLKSAWTT